MILSISVTSYIKKYLIFTIFIMIFGYVYELFSHNVYSIYMQYAFLIPLVLGLLLFIVIYLFKKEINRNIGITLYNNAVITLTVYSLLKGVLEIYGTTNILLSIFLYEAYLLFILSFIYKIISQNVK